MVWIYLRLNVSGIGSVKLFCFCKSDVSAVQGQERVKLRISNLACKFTESIRTEAH